MPWFSTTGSADADAIHDNVAGEISALTLVTAASGDHVLIEDASNSNNKARVLASDFLAGGGGGTVSEYISYLAARQSDETGHADDDFFDDDTIPGTGLTVSGTATWTEHRGRLKVVNDDQSSADLAARLTALSGTPAAPMTIETRLVMLASGATITAGLGFTDGIVAASNVVWGTVFWVSANGAYGWRERFGTLTSAYTTNNSIASHGQQHWVQTPIYIRVIWVASNSFKVGMSFSEDDDDFVYGSGVTPTFTPTHFGPMVSTDGGTAPSYQFYDYIRVYDADLSA